MKMMIGGAIAVVLALFGFAAFPAAFLKFLVGILPVLLILTGGLAIYVGRDQVNEADEIEIEPDTPEPQPAVPEQESVEPDAAVEPEVKPEQTDPEPVVPVEEKIELAEAAVSGFVGNTDTHVFHSPGCNFSKSKKCTANFSTKEEALEKGFKPCGVCKP